MGEKVGILGRDFVKIGSSFLKFLKLKCKPKIGTFVHNNFIQIPVERKFVENRNFEKFVENRNFEKFVEIINLPLIMKVTKNMSRFLHPSASK